MTGRTTLRFLTAGESHGPRLTAILEGMPAGLAIDEGELKLEMARRQTGFGTSGRQRIENDIAEISSGVLMGATTGAPIALTIENRDHANWVGRDIEPMTVPRPGHADLSAPVKYGYRDLRLALERASARETAARVAIGALCRQLLDVFGVRVGSHVLAIGAAEWEPPADADWKNLLESAEESDMRCADTDTSERMHHEIRSAAHDGDTLGGQFEVVALGVPAGLGSHVHWDRRLTGRLLGAVTSIPAVKGAEMGRAFDNSRQRGSDVHGSYAIVEGAVERRESGGGGLEGGITTGAPISLRAAMKPISTTLAPRPSVDLATGKSTETSYERSDICAVPRAAVVAEAMVAYVLADALLCKLGGDSLEEIRPRFEELRSTRLDDLPMNGADWRMYDAENADSDA